MKKAETFSKAICSVLVLAGFAVGIVGCGDKTRVLQKQTSMELTQDFNPPYLDILWVLDNRSQLFSTKPQLAEQAKGFFTRLDANTSSYRMGFVTADMLLAKGQLQPVGNPMILQKETASDAEHSRVAERTALFSSLLTGSAINVHTGGENKSLEATLIALQTSFQPRSNIPLVLVFISDSDDHSKIPSGATSAVDYYSKQFLALKGNNSSLLRVYSINYVKLTSGATVNTTNRCATLYNADIDSTNTNSDGSPYFQDRFFQLATQLGGATADLCGAFSSSISLEGLRLKELPSRFRLDSKPVEGSLQVYVYYRGVGKTVSGYEWRYDSATNEIVFNQAPPEGTNIHINYLPQ